MQPPAKTPIKIEPFSTSDYGALAKARERVMPEYPMTADELRFFDEQRPKKCKFQRFLAYAGSELVAFCEYDQSAFAFDPGKFDLAIFVLPEFQGKGIGSQLYIHLLRQVAVFKPVALRSFAREDLQQSVRFLRNRGFHETMRAWESRLDVQNFDFSRYDGHIERVESSGIKILSLAQIPRTVERDRKLYELDRLVSEDVPHSDPFTPLDFDNYLQRFIENPGIYPEAFQVAVEGHEFVGLSNIWKSLANRDLYNGLTGVRREYRRRGIALAMKLKNLQVVKEAGYTLIKTWNETNNRAMLSINEELGFVKQPAWINFAKDLKPGEIS